MRPRDGGSTYPETLTDLQSEDDGEAGFLYVSTTEPWPDDPADVVDRVPDDWLEEHRGAPRVRPVRRKELPLPVRVGTGRTGGG